MSDDWVTIASPVGIVKIYFHRGQASGIDVDNMSKPILDVLKGIVYEDDQFVEQLIARRTELHDNLRFQKVTPRLAEALETEGDCVLASVKHDATVEPLARNLRQRLHAFDILRAKRGTRLDLDADDSA